MGGGNENDLANKLPFRIGYIKMAPPRVGVEARLFLKVQVEGVSISAGPSSAFNTPDGDVPGHSWPYKWLST